MTEEQLKQLLALATVLNATDIRSHNFGEGNGIAAWFAFDSDDIADLFIEQVNSLDLGVEVELSQFVGLVFVNWV